MSTDPSDADLVARSLRSDRAAFGSLVERHQRLVVGVALARCGDPALAEDVAQDAFVAAWRDLGRLRDADRVGPWVAGIARNLAAGAMRRDGRRAVALEVGEVDAPATPEDEALRREDRELLSRALADVPVAHRDALTLYYVEGQSLAEIASALRVSEDVVKQRLSRGRRALRESVERRLDAVLAEARSRSGACHGAVPVGAAGKVLLMTAKQKVAAAIVAALAIAGGATWYATRDRGAPAAVAQTSGRAFAPVAPSPSAGSSSAKETPRARKLTPAERTALLAQIRSAQEARTQSADSHAAAGPAPSLDEPPVDRAYIKSAVHEILPMLADCYSEGLDRDPTLKGSVVVDFTIEGEPGVGGAIGSSAVVPDRSTLGDAQTRECIEQTMYALAIDPPAGGGVVHVTYPFEFSP